MEWIYQGHQTQHEVVFVRTILGNYLSYTKQVQANGENATHAGWKAWRLDLLKKYREAMKSRVWDGNINVEMIAAAVDEEIRKLEGS